MAKEEIVVKGEALQYLLEYQDYIAKLHQEEATLHALGEEPESSARRMLGYKAHDAICNSEFHSVVDARNKVLDIVMKILKDYASYDEMSHYDDNADITPVYMVLQDVMQDIKDRFR